MMDTNLRFEGATPIWEPFVNLSTLPGRKNLANHMVTAEEFLARRKAMHGGATMTAGTGEGNPPAGDGNPSAGEPGGGQQNRIEATDEHGVGLGFPKDTKTDDMTADEKANYWRTEAKKQQRRVPSNLEQLQTDAQAWQEHQRTLQQQSGGSSNDDRAQIEAQIREEAARDSALALLRTTLHTRGKNAEEIDELVKFVNPASFLTSEKKVDTVSVIAYLDKIAPTGTGGGGGGLPGQGRHEQQVADRAAAGKAESERRGFTKPSGTSSLLPSTS